MSREKLERATEDLRWMRTSFTIKKDEYGVERCDAVLETLQALLSAPAPPDKDVETVREVLELVSWTAPDSGVLTKEDALVCLDRLALGQKEKPLGEHSLIVKLDQRFPRWSLHKLGLLKWIAFGMDGRGNFVETPNDELLTPDQALARLMEGK